MGYGLNETCTEGPPLPNELSRAEVSDQLRALGVEESGVLLVHTSFRATRPVEGGPLGLIEALRAALGPRGTLAMPSWSGDDDEPFDRLTTPAAPDLGVVADTFWRLPGVLRSDHSQAFAAAGPQAAQIISGPLPLPPHIPESPVGRVYDLDGQVLLLGVGHLADTTLHLAELLADVRYRLPRYCTVLQDGQPVRIDYEENDHCCERFALADEWLRAQSLQSEGRVGYAHARLARSRDIVKASGFRAYSFQRASSCGELNPVASIQPRASSTFSCAQRIRAASSWEQRDEWSYSAAQLRKNFPALVGDLELVKGQ